MIKKILTVCFTGKRPRSMPWGFNEKDERCVELKQKLKNEIEKAISEGYAHFISGMALGADIYAEEAVLQLKKRFPHTTLEAALPCETQADRWNETDRERYFNLLPVCDTITYINKKYTPFCMEARNRYMVDNSDLLIAVYNGTGGGTENTIKYAKNKKIEIRLIEF